MALNELQRGDQAKKRTAARKKRAETLIPTLRELQCFRDIVEMIQTGPHRSANALFKKLEYVPSYCKATLERLKSDSRWKRRLINLNNLELTEDGLKAYQYACKVLDTHATGPFGKRREKLRIGTTNRVMTAFLGPKLQEYFTLRRRAADARLVDVDLELQESTIDEILEALRKEQIDLAIGGIPSQGPPSDLDKVGIGRNISTVLIAGKKGYESFNKAREARKEPVAWEELARANVCVIRSDLAGALAHLPKPGEGYSRIIVDNYASVVSVVQGGAAVGLVLDMGIPKEVLLQFEIDAKIQPRTLAVWKRKGEKLPPLAQEFLDVVTRDDSNG